MIGVSVSAGVGDVVEVGGGIEVTDIVQVGEAIRVGDMLQPFKHKVTAHSKSPNHFFITQFLLFELVVLVALTEKLTRAATACKAPSVEDYLKARFPSASRLRSGVGWKPLLARLPSAYTTPSMRARANANILHKVVATEKYVHWQVTRAHPTAPNHRSGQARDWPEKPIAHLA